MIPTTAETLSGRLRLAIVISSLAAMAWLFIARMSGPSDLWHQSQPRTVSYTTDILVHGGNHWILPVERGELPATKPPLFNWLAAPCVALIGFHSELAHKLPSVLALLGTLFIVVRLGNKLMSGGGWLAAMMLAASYPMFKLGYLARPDMLLVFWMLLAWMFSSHVLVAGSSPDGTALRRMLCLCMFWLCVVLAALTKGPAATVTIFSAFVTTRVIGGSWRSIALLHPVKGLAITVVLAGAWVWAAWRVNPDHVRDVLWYTEIYGRITGLGPEGSREGPLGWITNFPNQAIYFLARFIPWSLAAIAAMVLLFKQRKQSTRNDKSRLWIIAAAVHTIVVIGLFTLSTGKRADYIAVCFPQAALLAAWWMLTNGRASVGGGGGGRVWINLAPAAAAVMLVITTVVNRVDPVAPVKGFGDQIMQFAVDASRAIQQEPLPVVFFWTGEGHLQAMMGGSMVPNAHAARAQIQRGQPFWIVAGRKATPPHDFVQWLAERPNAVRAEAVVQSAVLPRAQGWPEQVTLYRVTPVDAPSAAE